MNAVKNRFYLPGVAGMVALVALLGAANPFQSDALQQEGVLALEAGDPRKALALFEQAMNRTTDPAWVAYHQATACYRLAMNHPEERAARLAEAVRLYRCCLEPDDPRRSRALVGLGTCLLLQAEDTAQIREALRLLDQAVKAGDLDESLRADARHNRELARLRLTQMESLPSPQQDPQNKEENPENSPSTPEKDPGVKPQPKPGNATGNEKPDPRGTPTQVSPDTANKPRATDQGPPPGKGTLPPIPDRSEPAPLQPEEAARHVETAASRILHEQQQFRAGKVRPTIPGLRDW